ncbi:propionyl-CoA--succinate CoA transferase [Actinomarinicola tropica]|uniref:Propionyl-CoA--succinate CoA transferase n=2 Tax=Actinomarinicola tropica TaxID=2789776 RepID=A0A5Q2RNP0_9ACTN|nr:propionyl-CoA--succinate CoA transferase [Actinomarinicola tropica]
MPLANGEPRTVVDAIVDGADQLRDVRIHQMHAMHDRPYLHGAHPGRLGYVAYFLSHVSRPGFHAGHIDLVPCNFSEVPMLLRRLQGPKLVIAAASPPDRHGYFSLGVSADYVSGFIGQVPFFIEANPAMPRTFGRNSVHVTQTVGWVEADYPLVEVEPAAPNETDERIADLIAERIPDGTTLQVGIGSIPNAVLARLTDHRDLGLHTELLSDGVIDLVLSGVLTGTRKRRRPGKHVTTFALGTRALYDFLHENPAVELLPVDYVNDPRVIATEPNFVSINATTEVDFLGQCASETIGGRYWSGSGGQADFARGALYADNGQGFVVLRSTTSDGSFSRIRPQLTNGSVVTTMKNTVDKVVTEFGVAELRGRSIRERTRALIRIAHPDFRDELERDAKELGYI